MKFNYSLKKLESSAVQQGTLIPLYSSFLGDIETPISLYQKLKQSYRYSFLLESAENDEKVGRYSFLGFGFKKMITFQNGKSILKSASGKTESIVSNDPFVHLQSELANTKILHDEKLPRLQAGYIGFVTYDCVQYFDDIILPKKSAYGVPEMQFVFPENLIVFDNLQREIYFLSYLKFNKKTLAKDYNLCVQQVQDLVNTVQNGPSVSLLSLGASPSSPLSDQNLNSEGASYEKNVLTALGHIKDGDIFQIVLSNRQAQQVKKDSLDIYRKLRSINPSPYMFLLDFEDMSVVGSSPETLVQVEGGNVLVRPIAGTRKRGATIAEDESLAEELLSDTKELAEHRMLVDLARNDVGRIATPGSVRVENSLHVQKYSHVMHIVSDVVGSLNPKSTSFDAFKACFPAGTLSGAPKIRAMQLISQLEKERRGIYGGAVGYFDLSGNMDFAIAIRTVVKKGDTAYIQAGAGIVFDSVPSKEFTECKNKSLSSLAALQ